MTGNNSSFKVTLLKDLSISFNACVSSCWQSLCRVVKVDSGVLNDVVKNPLTKTSISLYHVKSASPVILTPACGNECGSLAGNSPSSSRKSSALIETVAFFFFFLVRRRKSLQAIPETESARESCGGAGLRAERRCCGSPGPAGAGGARPDTLSPLRAHRCCFTVLFAPRNPFPKPSACSYLCL